MPLTHEESQIVRLLFRYEECCGVLGWNIELRQIGRALLILPGRVSISDLSRRSLIARATVVRRVAQLRALNLADQAEEGVQHTKLGRAIHIATHRDFLRLVTGQQVGLSPQVVRTLEHIMGQGWPPLAVIDKMRFPADLPLHFTITVQNEQGLRIPR